MIFGDRQQMAIEVDRFEPPWGALDPEQDAVWGAVTLWVAGKNLSEHRRAGTDRVRDDLHIPLLALARWAKRSGRALRFEERSPIGAGASPHDDLERWGVGRPPTGISEPDWLDRRDAWWSRHFTGAATSDVVAPSLGIVRNDDHALVSWRAPVLPRPDRTFVRPQGCEVVAWLAVRDALRDFVAAVVDWGPASAASGDEPDESGALEYYTGLARDEIDAFGFLAQAEREPAVDPLAQVVRDLTHRTAVGPSRESIVTAVRVAERPEECGWRTLRERLVPTSGTSFESDGYNGAQAARRILGLDGQPVDDVVALLRSLGIEVSPDSPPAHHDRMVVAATSGGGAIAMVLANERTATPWGSRFELVRAMGHVLLDELRGGAIGAASGPQALASRRRRAGAFAAEMLLPTMALEDASDGVLDGVAEADRFAQLLERYGVGANTAAYQLWNQGLLSSSEVRDDLVASVQR